MSGRSYPVDANEQSRLAELVRYRVLDSAPEAVFNDTVKLAQSLFGVSASLVSLIDDKRQWFKARVGIDACETGRDAAFCAYAILGDDVMVVPDARADPRFVHNPLVTSPPFIRFYAGAPLTTPAGYNIDTLCIFDPEPRPEGMSPLDRRHFAMLARIVIERLEARCVQLGRDEEAQALYDAADRLSATAAKLDGQADTLGAFSGDGARKSGTAARGVRRLVSIGQRVDEDVTQIAEDIAAATENACILRKTIGGMRLNLNDIVSVAGRITKIARQTNMLAINASIEAARAGDAGRGFAVIAREVGTLAASTADATDHIRATLQAIETTVAQSVGQCDGLADRIGEMNNRSGQIRTAAAMAAEIRIDIGTGIEQIATVAKHVGEQADTVKGSTAALLGEATTLRVHASGLAADRTETGRNRAVA